MDASQFIIPTEGAGREQLKHLRDLHQGHTRKRTTQTLIKIYHDFKYLTGPPKDGLSRYYQRLHELLHEMEETKPTPLVRNDQEILHTYRTGLIRADQFVEELRACDIGNYDLKATHKYLLENENLRGLHLRKLHGMSIKTADAWGSNSSCQDGESVFSFLQIFSL